MPYKLWIILLRPWSIQASEEAVKYTSRGVYNGADLLFSMQTCNQITHSQKDQGVRGQLSNYLWQLQKQRKATVLLHLWWTFEITIFVYSLRCCKWILKNPAEHYSNCNSIGFYRNRIILTANKSISSWNTNAMRRGTISPLFIEQTAFTQFAIPIRVL